MAKIGLVDSVYEAAISIEAGRKGFATRGKAEEGRISYEKGIAKALSAFQEASNQRFAVTADPETIILAKYTFISQELEFCEKTDKDSVKCCINGLPKNAFHLAFISHRIHLQKVLCPSGIKMIEKAKFFLLIYFYSFVEYP